MGSRAAAEHAAELYERKGAAALAERARRLQGEQGTSTPLAESGVGDAGPENACVRAGRRLVDGVGRLAWYDVEALFAPEIELESRRRIVGFPPVRLSFEGWRREMTRYVELGLTHFRGVSLAVRGDRLALVKLTMHADEADPGAPQDAALQVVGLDAEGRIALQVWFDVEDVEAALAELDSRHARFDAQRPIPRLDNAASRVDARFQQCFAARDWVSMAELLDEDLCADDRRRIVNAGVRQGRDAKVADMRVTAELGTLIATSTVIAVRGQRLALVRIRLAGRDQRPEAFRTEMLGVVEISRENRMAARVLFDLDDRAAAFADLDARYAAGEARAHAEAWSIIVEGCAFLKRHGIWPITDDFVGVDHRSGATSAPEDMTAFIRESALDTPGIELYVEAVHRLADTAAVITTVTLGTSTHGFDAEWRSIGVVLFEGRLIARTEVFDVVDLDAALVRFDELSRPRRLLENEATRCYERFNACSVTGDREGLAATMAEDFVADDRRRVVGSGRLDRDAAVDHARVLANLGVTRATSTILATRGNRLALMRSRFAGRDVRSDAFSTDVLHLAEVGEVHRMTGFAAFDVDDVNAAIAELDARYLAGEAEPFARTYSVIAQGFSTLNRREVPATTTRFVDVDHRSVTGVGSGDLTAYLAIAVKDTTDTYLYVEAVHRLSDVGAVITHVAKGVSAEGLGLEWRIVDLLTVEGELLDRCEIFDDGDTDAAIARFDDLSSSASLLENSASRVYDRWVAAYHRQDWMAMQETMADDVVHADYRSVVNGGTQTGRDAVITTMQAVAAVGVTNIEPCVIATRGDCLALVRQRVSGSKQSEAFGSYVLNLVEMDSRNLFARGVAFDVDGIDSALTELDSRYLAGEAAPHAQTWSLVMAGYAAFNRGELSALTSDFASIDHRRATAFAPGDLVGYLQAAWEDSPGTRIHIEAVHRLSDRGAVVTHFSAGTSRAGFHAEWRDIAVAMVDGDAFGRMELFDATDLDAALARFDELSATTPSVNVASRTIERFVRCFATSDWDALAETLHLQFTLDDRRRVVGAGIRRGRDAEIDDLRAFTDIGLMNAAFTVLATRGERLVLSRTTLRQRDRRIDDVHSDMLAMTEVDAEGRMIATVLFDPDDIDAANPELDARFMAGEGAPYASIWAMVIQTYAAFNRHELSTTTPDWVNIDHRLGVGSGTGEMNTYVSAMWEVVPDVSTRIEAVHRLSSLGAVFTHTERGTSQDGFAAEWREVALLSFNGDAINRCELFDERDLSVAVGRFDELDRQHPRTENAATRMNAHLAEVFNLRDEAGYLDACSAGARFDDRRRGMQYEGPIDATFAHELLSEAVASWRLETETLAIRGDHLALGRYVFRDTAEADRPVAVETLALVEVDADQRMTRAVLYDVDNSDDALAEIDVRYRDHR